MKPKKKSRAQAKTHARRVRLPKMIESQWEEGVRETPPAAGEYTPQELGQPDALAKPDARNPMGVSKE